MMNTRKLALSLTFAALATLGGCVIGSNTKTTIEGTYGGEETSRQIEPGSSKAYVLALLGEPTSTVDLGEGHMIWKWRYVERKRSSGSLLVLFSSESDYESASNAFVEFQGDEVLKAWRD